MVSDKPAMLVVSCDKYADIWSPFFQLFGRHWPDCPYRIFLGSNHREFSLGGVTSLAVGDDVSWAESVRRMIDRIQSSHVLMFLEDFFLRQRVDTLRVERLVRMAQRQHWGCLRLKPLPGPSRRVRGSEEIGLIAPGDAWRVSTQTALWRTDTLRSLLVPGFSPWDFECKGTPLSNCLPDTFCGVWVPALVYDHGVQQGQWRQVGLDICRQANVPIDQSVRPGICNEYSDPLRRRVRQIFSRRLPRFAWQVIHKHVFQPVELPGVELYERRAA